MHEDMRQKDRFPRQETPPTAGSSRGDLTKKRIVEIETTRELDRTGESHPG